MQASGVLAGKRRQPGSADPWKPDLAAVRMSRELQVHGGAGRSVGEVGFVYQQDHQFVAGDSAQGRIEVLHVVHHGIQTAQPNSRSGVVKRDGTVAENGNSM